jgi:septum formation protein
MNINGKRVILASKSPRRRELLGKITESFEIKVADVDETLPSTVHPREGVRLLAERKGAPIARDNPDAIVISSDTLVELGGVALGKPVDSSDAKRMLRQLSGKAHNVHTGVAVHYLGRVLSGVDSTAVIFREMTDSEIDEYVSGGEPMDKAGAYGIQGEGGKFVLGYDGRFDTVMGLSVSLVEKLVAEIMEDNRE